MENFNTTNELLRNNYTILNGKIIDVVTNVSNDTFTFSLIIQGDNWQCSYGNFNLFDEKFDSKRALIELSRVLEESDLTKLVNKNVRVAVEEISAPVELIGNIIYDNWYNFNNYYIKDEEKIVTENVEETQENVETLEEIKEDEV